MKWLILGLLALLASVVVALIALPDSGYVLVGYGNYSVETTLLAFAVVLVLVYLGLQALVALWRTPRKLQHWSQEQRNRRLLGRFDQAAIDFIEGNPRRAERRLAQLAHASVIPLASCLSAARAAGKQGATDRQEEYLRQALEQHPKAELAIGLVQAELQLAGGQTEQAQTVLIHLRKLAPRNVQVLRLLVQLYVQQEDWQKLHELLPDLRRRQVLDTEHWQRLAVQVYREQVTHLSSARELELLHDSWEELPLPVQQDDAFVGVYMEQLVRLGAHRQAEQAIVSSLKRHWNETLVDLFGNLSGSDAGGQLTIAESWLEQHPEDPVLLLALGKISIRNELWGRARGYLERSIELHPTPEGWRLLGQVLEQMDESQQAADCYRKGIDLLAGTTTLPAPEIEKALPLNRSV